MFLTLKGQPCHKYLWDKITHSSPLVLSLCVSLGTPGALLGGLIYWGTEEGAGWELRIGWRPSIISLLVHCERQGWGHLYYCIFM